MRCDFLHLGPFVEEHIGRVASFHNYRERKEERGSGESGGDRGRVASPLGFPVTAATMTGGGGPSAGAKDAADSLVAAGSSSGQKPFLRRPDHARTLAYGEHSRILHTLPRFTLLSSDL